jgi:hypothetical protein
MKLGPLTWGSLLCLLDATHVATHSQHDYGIMTPHHMHAAPHNTHYELGQTETQHDVDATKASQFSGHQTPVSEQKQRLAKSLGDSLVGPPLLPTGWQPDSG